jgi:hypothetical protein
MSAARLVDDSATAMAALMCSMFIFMTPSFVKGEWWN